jgi:hypothetical protein
MFKFGGRLGFCTLRFLIPLYSISCHIGDNVSLKLEGVDKHSVCLSVCSISCFVLFLSVYKNIFFFFLFVAMLLIGHDLHHNCGLHVVDVFNLFEQCISLEISVFDSCVGLERLHLSDCYFTCTLV